MSISASVGEEGDNAPLDVKLVQAAINQARHANFMLSAPLSVDGLAGPRTAAAIATFQRAVVGMATPDARVDPGGTTEQRLRESIPKQLTLDALRAVMGHSSNNIVDVYFPILKILLPHYDVATPLRTAHFLAQVGHESLSFKHTEEIASGEAYEGRADLGNTEPGDGPRFKGRGLIQLTGRGNYDAYSQYLGIDLLRPGQETLPARHPFYAVDVSLWFWGNRNLNRLADDDELRAITRRINGGYNGLEDRAAYLERAKFFLL